MLWSESLKNRQGKSLQQNPVMIAPISQDKILANLDRTPAKSGEFNPALSVSKSRALKRFNHSHELNISSSEALI